MSEKSAREILARFECRELCAERGEPPCFEIGKRLDPPVEYSPCDTCRSLTTARIAALSAAGLTIVPVEPTYNMMRSGQYVREDGGTIGTIWSAMLTAAKDSSAKEDER